MPKAVEKFMGGENDGFNCDNDSARIWHRVENFHLPFQRRERAMQRFRQMRTLQEFVAVHSSVHNHFSQERHLYIRLDWFTSDALPTWGDGRLTILGTKGYMELRKYVDVGGADGTDHLILVNGTRCEKINATDARLP